MASAIPRSKTWYEFYAMYAEDFVKGVFERVNLENGLVLDPWNGTGTTTTVAYEKGHASVGVDINPVMAVIAKSRIIHRYQKEAIESATWEAKLQNAPAIIDDPLNNWFLPSAVSRIRALQNEIHVFCKESLETFPISPQSESLCFLYVGLFRTIRILLKRFRSTNPTWGRNPDSIFHRLRPSDEVIRDIFNEEVAALLSIPPRIFENIGHEDKPVISIGNSDHLSLEDGAVDLIVTSPPYCTRIDYPKATLPELSLLGYDENSLKKLRNATLGTPTVSNVAVQNSFKAGGYVENLLTAIHGHSSKASAGYYSKTYQQYFRGLSNSISEIARVTRSEGHAVFVVQDSYYKDIHVDLAEAYCEILSCSGFHLLEKVEFKTRTIAAMHKHRAQYRSEKEASEAVLLFKKS